MRGIIEKIMPVPLAVGVLAALLLIVGLDYNALGRVESGAEEAAAKEISASWVAKNDSRILKGVQSLLFGTGSWVTSLGPEQLTYAGISVNKAAGTRTALYRIEHKSATGMLEVVVDLGRSSLAGVGPSVTSVTLLGVAPKNGAPGAGTERIYSASELSRGRVRYYLEVFASIAWHMVLAGILFAPIRLTGLTPRLSMGLALLLSVVIVAWASSKNPAYLIGAASLGMLSLAWGASEFIRRKRHLEVLRIITG